MQGPEGRVARLPGYRVAFNKRGSHQGEVYANIVEQDGREVWGALYQLQPDELRVLDQYEGVDKGHYRRDRIEVITEAGDTVNAETYFAGERWLCSETKPSREYAMKILTGTPGS